MSSYIVGGRKITPDPSQALGKGGEADVYIVDVGGVQKALKIFKPPTHPDIRDIPDPAMRAQAADAARRRIDEHQSKLRAFPTGLPARVVVPQELALDSQGRVAGYTMPIVRNADLIMYYANGKTRRDHPHLKDDALSPLFAGLYTIVAALHARGVVIGDFNDLNVLCVGSDAYLLDADSMQFGPYPCRVFTEHMVDPKLCDPSATRPMLVERHNADSDWFAFAIMLFQSCLWVGPWGGIYKPPAGQPPVKQGERSLRRLSVLHGNGITYPRPARRPELIPPELAQHFVRVFEQDARGTFPLNLITNLRWTTCPNCGAAHARARCPTCSANAPAAVVVAVTVKGKVTATVAYPTPRERGQIVHAAAYNGQLQYIAHESDGTFRREGGTEITRGQRERGMRLRVWDKATVIGASGNVLVLAPHKPPERQTADVVGGATQVDTNHEHVYWSNGGWLYREGMLGVSTPELIGQVLANQTRFWVGPKFGFGFYQASEIFRAFVFDAEARRSLNDGVPFPRPLGQLVHAHCVFSPYVVWVLTVTQHNGVQRYCCTLVGPKGEIVATLESDLADNPWLESLPGACALGSSRHALLVPTDKGIVRVEENGGHLAVTTEFPDSSQWVDGDTQLLLGQELIAVTAGTITRLKLQ